MLLLAPGVDVLDAGLGVRAPAKLVIFVCGSISCRIAKRSDWYIALNPSSRQISDARRQQRPEVLFVPKVDLL